MEFIICKRMSFWNLFFGWAVGSAVCDFVEGVAELEAQELDAARLDDEVEELLDCTDNDLDCMDADDMQTRIDELEEYLDSENLPYERYDEVNDCIDSLQERLDCMEFDGGADEW